MYYFSRLSIHVFPFPKQMATTTTNNKHLHLDPPSFIERPQSIESEIGENITMNCVVDSNPKADIIWVFDPIDRVRVVFILLSAWSFHLLPTMNTKKNIRPKMEVSTL